MRHTLVLRAALCAVVAATCLQRADAIIESNVCNQVWSITWSVKRFGPIFMCSNRNATVSFTWDPTEQHGIFLIPSDRCPSNFTAWATDDYKELAPVSMGGTYTYQVPDQAGMYWLTSQAGTDCTDGMSAQIQVMDASTPSVSSAEARLPQLALAVVAAAAALVPAFFE